MPVKQANKDKKNREEFEKIQGRLRKQIADKFKGEDAYKSIFKKELIKNDLAPFLEMGDNDVEGDLADNRELLNEFRNFTTYFTGFHQNRENMYSDEAKSTAIAYRLIHENLPRFIDNIAVFKKIAAVPELREKIAQVYTDCQEYLNVCAIDEMFCLEYYNMVLTQRQISVYNMIVGGRTEKEGEKKIQGINEFVNLYNQKQADKSNKLPKLKPLFKQILSDREAISWLPEAFEKDNNVLVAIKKAYADFFIADEGNVCMAEQLKDLLCNIGQYSADGIYVANDSQLTDISQQMTGSWQTLKRGLCKLAEPSVVRKKKETDEAYEERVSKAVKSQNNIALSEMNAALQVEGVHGSVEDYFASLGAIDTEEKQEVDIFTRIRNAASAVETLLAAEYPEDKHLAQSEREVELIKNLLDAIKDLQHFVKPLLGKDIQGSKDERFYSELLSCWSELDKFTPLYSRVRNYMTKKPYSEKKIKLNFSNSQLLSGWDINKEKDNTAVILRKDGLYYLAIMNKKYNKSFEMRFAAEGDCFEKMDYKLLPGPNKMLPKVFFSKKGLETFQPSAEILDVKERESFKKGDGFNLAECHRFIDFYKDAISRHEDWSKFGFEFSSTESYPDISGFYREVEAQGYKLSFRPIPVSYVDQLVADGKIYLFQIYNKDFSPYSKGTPNMHTLYWKMLFDPRNLANVVYKLNGEAEVFFRKSSITPTKPTHPANRPIANKNEQNTKKESLFAYDLIKDRRYTVDKFLFHVPITMNFVSEGISNINNSVREYISKAEDLHIIGIDRGERHLLYLTVIDLKGNIKKQFSLNEIVNEYNGNAYATDYHKLLDAREKERQKSRQSWKSIETIKELKEGYLSQVVHKIAQLMVEYHAIVVLEDLNWGFMRGRQKVEKSVYQKFEKMLIDKLNYLVDKKADTSQPSGVLKALQLTNKVDTLSQKGKQNGFLFYIPAWNTSKIDPVTGFANLFSSEDLKYTSARKAADFFGKFDAIRYNADKDWFEFKFDYRNFTSKAEGTKEQWTLCTYGQRIRTFRNPAKNSQWDNEEVVLTPAFKSLFEAFGIDIRGNIQNAILGQGKEFFDGKDNQPGFYSLFNMLLQMRNSITGSEVDYLISPVADADGNFFDSRNNMAELPCNADSNGAYNIARKGLMAVRQIKEATDSTQPEFDISNKAWLAFAQTKPYLND